MTDEDCVKKCLSETEIKQPCINSPPRHPAIEIAAPSVEDVEPWDIPFDFVKVALNRRSLADEQHLAAIELGLKKELEIACRLLLSLRAPVVKSGVHEYLGLAENEFDNL
ncbi:hypothetical protein P879_00180 [Paragonimus westermani]|uniref:Uncharacterized protein n=1 Tax=Paragonimus westermani TaxID=34504 RepID=A0A8T0DXE2_9TREM|nr:hypothetical protein P879_00180 [Paragonimus westermani]